MIESSMYLRIYLYDDNDDEIDEDDGFHSSIWDHMVEITKERNTTVIITTHYIDETKQASLVSTYM